jgi:hypothetical protein
MRDRNFIMRLSAQDDARLKALAAANGVSAAEAVRRLVEREYTTTVERTQKR